MDNIINIKEFKDLILKYESITRDDITAGFKVHDTGGKIMNMLTGFGDVDVCTLCKAMYIKPHKTNNICDNCVWALTDETNNHDNAYCFGRNKLSTCETKFVNHIYNSYKNISFAETPDQLKSAIGYRIKVMKQVIDKYNL